MKTLTYSITINKPVGFVFDQMTNNSLFPGWAKAWGENMACEGTWEAGTNIFFFDATGSGTKVVVEEVVPNKCIKMKHIAMVEDRDKEVTELDEMMQKWIGAQEDYYFKTVTENETTVEVIITADEAFEEMMNAWPQALQYFKEICEVD